MSGDKGRGVARYMKGQVRRRETRLAPSSMKPSKSANEGGSHRHRRRRRHTERRRPTARTTTEYDVSKDEETPTTEREYWGWKNPKKSNISGVGLQSHSDRFDSFGSYLYEQTHGGAPPKAKAMSFDKHKIVGGTFGKMTSNRFDHFGGVHYEARLHQKTGKSHNKLGMGFAREKSARGWNTPGGSFSRGSSRFDGPGSYGYETRRLLDAKDVETLKNRARTIHVTEEARRQRLSPPVEPRRHGHSTMSDSFGTITSLGSSTSRSTHVAAARVRRAKENEKLRRSKRFARKFFQGRSRKPSSPQVRDRGLSSVEDENDMSVFELADLPTEVFSSQEDITTATHEARIRMKAEALLNATRVEDDRRAIDSNGRTPSRARVGRRETSAVRSKQQTLSRNSLIFKDGENDGDVVFHQISSSHYIDKRQEEKLLSPEARRQNDMDRASRRARRKEARGGTFRGLSNKKVAALIGNEMNFDVAKRKGPGTSWVVPLDVDTDGKGKADEDTEEDSEDGTTDSEDPPHLDEEDKNSGAWESIMNRVKSIIGNGSEG